MSTKIITLGLDGLNPELIEKWLDDLPHLKAMQQEGIWGEIESTVPPVTPPAWTCVQSSRNPGAFGFWDFRFRDDYSYGQPKLISSKTKDERVDSLYKLLPLFGQKVAIINLPVSWPPPRIPGGYSISCFMTPTIDADFTSPISLKNEVYQVVGEYILDVKIDYRQIKEDKLLKRAYEMDSQRFALLEYFYCKKQCDCVFTVAMGLDRVSHFFCRHFDENDERYDSDLGYNTVVHDYYIWIDEQIGKILNVIDDKTVFLVHSAYSVQKLNGRINLNEWLIQEGYLVVHEYPSEPTPLARVKVDWSKTKAWATGYSGQLYLNMKGREVEGIVDPDDCDILLDELAKKLTQIVDEEGNVLKTQVFKRKEIHSGPFAQYGPDLFVFFDDCRWNTSELVGYGLGSICSSDIPLRPDDGAHGFRGYFCIVGAGIPPKGPYFGATILDIAPTLLEIMDLEIPKQMEGKSILGRSKTAEDEKKLRYRLQILGY